MHSPKIIGAIEVVLQQLVSCLWSYGRWRFEFILCRVPFLLLPVYCLYNKNCLSDSYLSVEKHNFIPFFTSVGKHSLHVEISAIIQMYNAHLMNMNEQ